MDVECHFETQIFGKCYVALGHHHCPPSPTAARHTCNLSLTSKPLRHNYDDTVQDVTVLGPKTSCDIQKRDTYRLYDRKNIAGGSGERGGIRLQTVDLYNLQYKQQVCRRGGSVTAVASI